MGLKIHGRPRPPETAPNGEQRTPRVAVASPGVTHPDAEGKWKDPARSATIATRGGHDGRALGRPARRGPLRAPARVWFKDASTEPGSSIGVWSVIATGRPRRAGGALKDRPATVSRAATGARGVSRCASTGIAGGAQPPSVGVRVGHRGKDGAMSPVKDGGNLARSHGPPGAGRTRGPTVAGATPERRKVVISSTGGAAPSRPSLWSISPILVSSVGTGTW